MFQVQQQDIPYWWHWLGSKSNQQIYEVWPGGIHVCWILQTGTNIWKVPCSFFFWNLIVYVLCILVAIPENLNGRGQLWNLLHQIKGTKCADMKLRFLLASIFIILILTRHKACGVCGHGNSLANGQKHYKCNVLCMYQLLCGNQWLVWLWMHRFH